MTTLFQPLKERKLVQWALAYLAGAWVLYEATGTALEAWDIPVVLVRSLHVLLIIGFFVTLVIAWYHGEKGRQRVSGPELLMVAALLVVAGVALSSLGPGGGSPGSAGPAPSAFDRPSLIVLTCRSISPRPEDAYLAEGLHEAILHRLAGISSLAVLGRETAHWYRDNPRAPSEIAAERGLEFVGECSVRKDPTRDRILFTFQLLDAGGVHVWSKEYERDLSAESLFAIQTDIAQQVARAVGTMLTPQDQVRLSTPLTRSDDAYTHFLQGLFYFRDATEESKFTAIHHLREAIALDSSFAQAHSVLSGAYTWLCLFSPSAHRKELFASAERAALTALSLDPDLASAHARLGTLHFLSRHDWAGAERELRRAIELDPWAPEGHLNLGMLLSNAGRHEEAIDAARTGIQADPFGVAANWGLAFRYYWAGQYDEALRQFDFTLGLAPNSPLVWLTFAFPLALDDRIARAENALSRWAQLSGLPPDRAQEMVSLASEYHRTGVFRGGSTSAEILEHLPFYWRYRLAAYLGDDSTALGLLEEADEDVWFDLVSLQVDPIWDPLRDHPRFRALVDRYADDVEH